MFPKSSDHDGSDVEKSEKLGAPVYEDNDGAVHHESFEIGNTLYARLQRVAGKFGIEQRGTFLKTSFRREDRLSITQESSVYLKMSERTRVY